ncbi:MAG: putative oxidoreductase [Caulobacteraceae bacterium]|nr:putative oxidoreductase [Caulobacteraceae bacterium]
MPKLLAPDPQKIGRPPGPAFPDAVPETLLHGTPEALKRDLIGLLGPAQVKTRLIDLVRYASDASPYRLTPQVVVLPRTPEEVAKVLAYCRLNGRHATFRAAGTSLNGQAQSDDILIDVRRHWTGGKVEADGQRLRVRPGLILAHANAMLQRYGRKLGPDPASGHACTLGGVIANNSGGMRCTIPQDAYHTVSALTVVLPSGTVVDTAAPGAEAAFAAAEPELARGLMAIREEILTDEALTARIRHKYSIRNTHGLRLLAFLDGETPLQIFRRLLVGSEGILGFIAEAVIETVPLPAVTSVAWIPLPSIDAAVELTPALVGLGAAAVELMVAPALTAAGEAFSGTPAYWRSLDPKAAALLVEFGADSPAAIEVLQAKVAELVAPLPLLSPLSFTSVTEAVELAWHVREGLLGLVGKQRPAGAMLITEDVCFPRERLAQGAHDLQALLAKHGFIPGVAGHAAHGNLHFTLVARLDEAESRARYSAFMAELVDLVVNTHDGSLKAEHGTGINMAPFVRAEWGDRATEIMWEIKALCDPFRVLAPNVILTRDDQVHLKALKSVPTIENVTDSSHCIECGFCEPMCPSRNVTTTPRQRIVLRREMARQPEESPVLRQLRAEFEYDGIETCAGDGTCAIPCPIGINTGALMREFRKAEHGPQAEAVALSIAKRWGDVEALARLGLGGAEIVSRTVGVGALRGLTEVARAVISADLVPTVPGPMPRPARKRLPATRLEDAAAVYFPACINRMFGRDPDAPRGPSLPEALVALSARAGRPVWIPDDVAGLCCSTPFSSKGFKAAHQYMAEAIADAFWRWSDEGRRPLVIDAASCTLGIAEDVARYLDPARKALHEKLTILDSIQWCRQLLPNLPRPRKIGRIAVHPTCSMTHLGLNRELNEIAEHLATEVHTPIGTTCCGTAGDRGLLHPELVRSATRDEKAGLDAWPADAYVSANRTCEMGLRHATGRPYESFVFLLEELSRPEAGSPTR